MNTDVKLIETCKDSERRTIFVINVPEMIKQKHKIPMQYEEISVGGNSDDMHYLCKKIDRYLLHIVEEITEFLDEFNKVNKFNPELKNYTNHKECLMELIDVIAYITSLSSILCIDCYGLEEVKKLDLDSKFVEPFSIYTSFDFDDCNKDVKYVVDSNLLNIECKLINGIRRKFPERKWHKDTNRILSVSELYDLYTECIDSSIAALRIAMKLFLYLTDYNYELFSEMFLDKNEEVYSLKK